MRTIESYEASEFMHKRVEQLESENVTLREDKARLEKELADFREYHDRTLDEWSERC